jgi:hypothetical protein
VREVPEEWRRLQAKGQQGPHTPLRRMREQESTLLVRSNPAEEGCRRQRG